MENDPFLHPRTEKLHATLRKRADTRIVAVLHTNNSRRDKCRNRYTAYTFMCRQTEIEMWTFYVEMFAPTFVFARYLQIMILFSNAKERRIFIKKHF